MPQLKFQGHSDDTFGEYGHFMDDYDCCASGRPIVYKLTSGGDGMYVYGQYGGRSFPKECPGCWMIGVQQLDEDIPFPWPMRFETEGYSPVLIIDAPSDVRLECLNRGQD